MTGRSRGLLQALGVAAVAVGYAVLAHLSNSTPGASALGVTLAVGPVLLFVVAVTWRSAYRFVALLLCAACGMLIYRYWSALEQHFPLLYLAQQAGVYGLLGYSFGRTLAGDRIPLCTQWAVMVHGPLAPAVARYTRAVTVAWTAFFGLLTITLIGLFAIGPLSVWSAFANFGAFPLVVAMFVGEYAVRRWALPDMERAHILDGVRAYLAASRGAATAGRG